MPIHDEGYRHYTGARRGRLSRAFVIANSGTRLVLKKRFLIALVFLGIIPAFLLAVFLYQASRVGDFTEDAGRILYDQGEWVQLTGGKNPAVQDVWQVIFSKFYIWQLLTVTIVVSAVGPELISKDLRVGALQLYYARPLTPIDYVLGKLMIVGVFVAIVTLVPAILLYLVGVILEKDIGIVAASWHTLVGIFLGYLLITLVGGVLVLFCSSLSRRSVTVAMTWAVIVVVPEVVYNLVRGTMAPKWAHLVSIHANVSQVLTRVFGARPVHDYDWFASFFVLAALLAVTFAVLVRRVRTMEGEH